jgi:putative NIF3 family GTP cyclohydrolase 1 type 2
MALSRRRFLLVAAAGQAARAQSGALTARQVIERIQRHVGIPWRAQTVDMFKAGNPDTAVKGIATTVMSTLEVLQRAARAGRNLVITHEPTFYNHLDETKDLAKDQVYAAKMSFIEKNNLVVWRFHDHWHDRQPDGIFTGLAKVLRWDKYQSGGSQRFYVLPGTTLGALAKDIQSRMKIRTMRVIGDPQTKVSRVALSPGAGGLMAAVGVLPEADVLVVGEQREWEGVEYAQDTVAAGYKKGLIILGHAISEDPGMDECARWLKTFITEVPIEFIPAGEPFWRP